MNDEFFVEGRHFPNSLWAFTFAGIQADRMLRPVEVHIKSNGYYKVGTDPTWHATAYPSNFVRSHLVRGEV
jgi:hypothetical protein